MKSLLSLMLSVTLMSGCVSLRSVSQTQIPAKRSGKVMAESEKWIIFFLSFDNDFVDKVSADLKRKCQKGKVTGILTKDENVNYFLGLVMKRRIVAHGYCNKRA